MDFVTSAANLRMHIFSMNMKSRFDVKCKLVVSCLYSKKLVTLEMNYNASFAVYLFNECIVHDLN